jgi:glycine cleavage system protein P-like pyridoxal-binding family
MVSSNKKKSKLDPRGEFGKLIGFNPEIKSYRILRKDGTIVDSKNVDFLDFNPTDIVPIHHDELLVESTEKESKKNEEKLEETVIKDEEEDDPMENIEEATQSDPSEESESSDDAEMIA